MTSTPTVAKRQPPTPAQVHAEQTRMLEADKARAAAPPAGVPAVVKPRLPAVPLRRMTRYLDRSRRRRWRGG